jgi:hypothetical protein
MTASSFHEACDGSITAAPVVRFGGVELAVSRVEITHDAPVASRYGYDTKDSQRVRKFSASFDVTPQFLQSLGWVPRRSSGSALLARHRRRRSGGRR